MTWGKDPTAILRDVNELFEKIDRLPTPDPMTIVVHPRQWALMQAVQLYWQLRDQGVNWRRAKRMRRREWERLKKVAGGADGGDWAAARVTQLIAEATAPS